MHQSRKGRLASPMSQRRIRLDSMDTTAAGTGPPRAALPGLAGGATGLCADEGARTCCSRPVSCARRRETNAGYCSLCRSLLVSARRSAPSQRGDCSAAWVLILASAQSFLDQSLYWPVCHSHLPFSVPRPTERGRNVPGRRRLARLSGSSLVQLQLTQQPIFPFYPILRAAKQVRDPPRL